MTQLSFFESAAPSPTPKALPDITRGKSHGHRNSELANVAIHPTKAGLRDRVHKFVAGCAERGTTIHEIAKFLEKPVHSVSGRVSELKADNLIFDSGRDRDGCSVLVQRREWCNGSSK